MDSPADTCRVIRRVPCFQLTTRYTLRVCAFRIASYRVLRRAIQAVLSQIGSSSAMNIRDTRGVLVSAIRSVNGMLGIQGNLGMVSGNTWQVVRSAGAVLLFHKRRAKSGVCRFNMKGSDWLGDCSRISVPTATAEPCSPRIVTRSSLSGWWV